MIEKIEEKVYIIKPILNKCDDNSLDEIIALAESAGAVVVGSKTQVLREITPATFIGCGKLQEIKEEIEDAGLEIDLIVFDGELSPSQTLNIQEILSIKVIDRTTLILDIFALNAKSTEGKLQVELAQLKYIYPRLRGKGTGAFSAGRRHRHARAWRNEAGNRQKAYPPPHRFSGKRTERTGESPRLQAGTPRKKQYKDGRFGGLYEYRKKYAFEPFDRR